MVIGVKDNVTKNTPRTKTSTTSNFRVEVFIYCINFVSLDYNFGIWRNTITKYDTGYLRYKGNSYSVYGVISSRITLPNQVSDTWWSDYPIDEFIL